MRACVRACVRVCVCVCVCVCERSLLCRRYIFQPSQREYPHAPHPVFRAGHQLSAMMSSCCIVRELQCPPLRRQRVTSYQNLSSDITSGLERYKHDRFQRKKVFNPVSFERHHHDRFQGKKVFNPVSFEC